MKLLYVGKEAWEEAYVKEKLVGVDVAFHLGQLDDLPECDESVEALSIFINNHIGATELDRYPSLKLLATRSTGFDHIDLVEAKRRGISVASVPSYGVNTVAEFAFALILSLSRRISLAHKRVKEEGSFSQEGLTGFDLEGKTMGIVGCGRIGVHSVRIANGFGMKVLVADEYQDQALADSNHFTYVPLDELLAEADVISLHVPYMPATHHLINKGNIGKIKKGAYLINTARGAVVETEALVTAIKEGTLGGAGLDVLEGEGHMGGGVESDTAPELSEEDMKIVAANRYLMTHPRVIITPHIAFDTTEAIHRILDTTVENIIAFEKGTPQNILSV